MAKHYGPIQAQLDITKLLMDPDSILNNGKAETLAEIHRLMLSTGFDGDLPESLDDAFVLTSVAMGHIMIAMLEMLREINNAEAARNVEMLIATFVAAAPPKLLMKAIALNPDIMEFKALDLTDFDDDEIAEVDAFMQDVESTHRAKQYEKKKKK